MLKRFQIIILLIAAVTSISCSREKTEEAATQGQGEATNPYSTTSVFDEVQNKLRENPDDPDLWYHIADLYDRNALYEKEIEALKKTVELKPDMGYAYFKMGTAYSRLNRSEEAVEAFQLTIKYMPQYAVAYNNLGIAYGKLGRAEEEIQALRKAIDIRPNYASARYNLGVTYLKVGKTDAAKQQHEELLEIDERIAEELLKRINENGGA